MQLCDNSQLLLFLFVVVDINGLLGQRTNKATSQNQSLIDFEDWSALNGDNFLFKNWTSDKEDKLDQTSNWPCYAISCKSGANPVQHVQTSLICSENGQNVWTDLQTLQWNNSTCSIELSEQKNRWTTYLVQNNGTDSSEIFTIESSYSNVVKENLTRISQRDIRYIDFDNEGHLIGRTENFCYDWIGGYFYSIVESGSSNKNTTVITRNDTYLNIIQNVYETDNQVEKILCISHQNLLVFTERINTSSFSLKFIRNASHIDQVSLANTFNIHLASGALCYSYLNQFDRKQFLNANIYVLTDNEICELDLLKVDQHTCRGGFQTVPTTDHVLNMAHVKDHILSFNELGLQRISCNSLSNCTIDQLDTSTRNISDIKSINRHARVSPINFCNFSLNELNVTVDKSETVFVIISFDNTLFCRNISLLPIHYSLKICVQNVDVAKKMDSCEEFEHLARDYSWKHPFEAKEKNKNFSFAVTASILTCKEMSICHMIRSVDVFIGSSINDEARQSKEVGSEWLFGALAILILVVLLQFVWLLRQKPLQSIEGIAKLSRIHSDQITWLRLIDSGHFGEVWEGKMKSFGTRQESVALKLPKTSSAKEYLLEEAIILNTLEHNNIVMVKGLCMHSTRGMGAGRTRHSKYPPVLVFEFMNGGSCLDYMKKNRMVNGLDQLRKISSDILEACIYLEERQIIHRDIALRNVLVQINENGGQVEYAKLSDFGLAKDVSGDANPSYETVCGLFPNRTTAPEGMSRGEFTTKSDVWSYGVLLWELFTVWETGKNATPYGDIPDNFMLRECICTKQRRLDRPVRCPETLYECVRNNTWSYDPSDRSSFDELKMIMFQCWPENNQNVYFRFPPQAARFKHHSQVRQTVHFRKRPIQIPVKEARCQASLNRQRQTSLKRQRHNHPPPPLNRRSARRPIERTPSEDSYQNYDPAHPDDPGSHAYVNQELVDGSPYLPVHF